MPLFIVHYPARNRFSLLGMRCIGHFYAAVEPKLLRAMETSLAPAAPTKKYAYSAWHINFSTVPTA